MVLGAAGFIGREVVAAARARGFFVHALVRTEAQAAELRLLGATPIVGDVRESERFSSTLAGLDAVLDLIQPALPARLSDGVIRRASAERVVATRSLLAAVTALPPHVRPLLFSVSGMADLAKDQTGMLSADSQPRNEPNGFARIGLPVRELVRSSWVAAAFVHLGTVYGPGKSFAARVLPGLARGKVPVVGNGENRMALIHVADAARALVHLASLDRAQIEGKTWLLSDGAGTTQREFLTHAAELVHGPVPRRLPRWLVSLVAGCALATTMAEDSPVDNSALLSTGFRFRHPSHRSGLPATVRALSDRSGVVREATPAVSA
ncbi:MAG TPA: NAD(P)-dependent oxidoreductase [Polyangiaceae bacterium]